MFPAAPHEPARRPVAAALLLAATTLLPVATKALPAATTAPRRSGEPCPASGEILARLTELRPERAARTRLFGQEPPWELYRKALERPGRTVAERHGLRASGVVLASLPVEALWMAINDEEHHALGDYLPILDSRVVGGRSRGTRRLLYQHFRRAGVGRWWIDEVELSGELYRQSRGGLWELRWRDLMSEPEGARIPEGVPDPGVRPIAGSVGAWLLVPLGDDCTLVEFYTRSDPGGFLSLLQWLAAGRIVRDTVQGMMGLAVEHVPEPHPGARFVRPDGTPLARDSGTATDGD